MNFIYVRLRKAVIRNVAILLATISRRWNYTLSRIPFRPKATEPQQCTGGNVMPEKEVSERARKDEDEGKSPSTQAGEFVREEMDHIREGRHGARSPQQAIAIGLSKARRAGVNLPPPKKGTSSSWVRAQAERDLEKGQRSPDSKPSRTRSNATSRALKREGGSAASHEKLSRQARTAASKRGSQSRHDSAMSAVQTKGRAGLRGAGRKAVRARAKHRGSA
jgi:hypothetical protein